jgi:DNA repair photolyase
MAAKPQLFEIARRRFDTPGFRGMEFIEVEAKSILNHVPGNAMPFSWTINPYRGCSHACVYCFARPTHTFLDMNAGRDFESKIVVKVNAPEVLRRELAAPRWKGEHVAMGTATDPYQRAEGRYRLMPRIISALAEAHNPFSILTKGTLLLRDLDLLRDASATAPVSAAFSIGTLDEEAWRRTEPGTPHPKERMAAVARLNEAGIPCGVLMAPVLPGITDSPRMLHDVVAAALDAGATHVSPILLHLRPGVREEFMDWLAGDYPELVGRYTKEYARPYATPAARRQLGRQVSSIVRSLGGVQPSSAETSPDAGSKTGPRTPPQASQRTRWSRGGTEPRRDEPAQLTLL